MWKNKAKRDRILKSIDQVSCDSHQNRIFVNKVGFTARRLKDTGMNENRSENAALSNFLARRDKALLRNGTEK